MAVVRRAVGGGNAVPGCTRATALSSQSVMTLPAAAVIGAVSNSASNIHSRFTGINASLNMIVYGLPAALGSRFKDHVERRLHGASDVAEPARGDDLAQFGLADLRAERGTHFLGQRGGN